MALVECIAWVTIVVWVAWVHKIGVGGVGRDFGVGDMGP